MLQSRRARAAAWIAGGLIPFLSIGRAVADSSRTVAPGDTLSGIASLYSVTVDALMQLNDIANPNVIFPGDILKIPGQGDEPPTGPGVYIVQAGDTLSAIAARYGVSVSAIQEANALADSDLIIAGEKLIIPSEAPLGPLALLPAEPPQDPDLEGIIDQFAAAERLEPGLVKALAYVESGWNQGGRSSAGAVGVMQLMPETSAWLERDVFHYDLNEDESMYDNVKAGTRLLRILLDGSDGNFDSALASYYQGQGGTSSGIMYDDTKGYVRFVRGVWERYWR